MVDSVDIDDNQVGKQYLNFDLKVHFDFGFVLHKIKIKIKYK